METRLFKNKIKVGQRWTNNSAARIRYETISIGGASMAHVFIREPINAQTTTNLPVLLAYLGDGADNGATTTITDQAMSSGDTFTWTATGSNSGSNRIVSSTLVVRDDGIEIARGQIGGTITGPFITSGSVGLTGSSSSITITSSVALSGTISVTYTYSTAFVEGLPLTMNQGDDFDERGIVVAVQSLLNDLDLTIGYFDNIIQFLWLNYDIDPDRIYGTGLSRGARQLIRVSGLPFSINTRGSFWINELTGAVSATDLGAGYVASGWSSLSLATSDFGGTYTVANYDKIGVIAVQGTNDLTLTNNMPSAAATWGADATLNEYPYMLALYNVGHSATVWHTNFYYRKYGSVGGGTAPWDYVDWHFKYSRNDEDCATLFVEQAEKRREGDEHDIFDYREAIRKVSQLGAGAVKTALEGRLATLKATLDSEIEWRVIINHTTAAITSTGNYNDQTTHVDNARVDDLVDDNGNVLTGIDWFIGNNPLASAYEAEFGSSRGYSFTSGFPTEVNRAGMRISSTVCPVGFAGLPAGTYTLRLFHNETSGTFSQIELTATIGGVTHTDYSQYNRLIGYTEWTGLDETDLANFDIGRNTGDTYVTAVELIRVN
jgi:hypothetical protein